MSEPAARRLNPLTFIVGAIREAAALLVAGAAGIVVGGLSTGVYFAIAGITLGLLHHVVRWATFTYRVYGDRIELRKELIGRSVKNIPLDRIRGVDVSAGPAQRLLGLAVVHIDAAAGGGQDEEAVLNAVSRDEAVRLRHELLSGRAEQVGHGAAPPAAELVRARRAWYLYAPLSGAYLFTPFALIGSALGALYNLGDDLGLITQRRIESLGRQVAGVPVLAGVVVFVLLVVAMPIASVVVFALFNWNFTLVTRDGSIVAERGLLTRRSVTLERRRIRGVELLDNPLERLAGVVRLRALVTGLGDAAHRGTLLPASPAGVADEVAGRIVGAFGVPLVRHPKAARTRRVVRAVLPPLGAAAIAVFTGQPWAIVACLVLAVLAVPVGLDRYRQLGHAADDLRLSVRSGSLRRRRFIVERRAVVGWQLRQTLFQRRLGLATLVAAVGAGNGEITSLDMAAPDAVALARRITPDWITPFLEPAPAAPAKAATDDGATDGPASGGEVTRGGGRRT
ncbi:MAG TPA: PH domain-containing protein [Streptosporangiaceae bacterium]|jgi:putative membrane protein